MFWVHALSFPETSQARPAPASVERYRGVKYHRAIRASPKCRQICIALLLCSPVCTSSRCVLLEFQKLS